MSIKYLSPSGLSEVWSNIKAYIASKIPSKIVTGLSIKGRTITYTNSDGTTGTLTTQDTDTTYANMTGATASVAGTAGLVPAPSAGKQVSFLRGDGTWVVPTNTTYASMSASEATTGTATTARTISAKTLHDKINSNLSTYATKTELNNGLATKANDSVVAHKAYAETISGAWSFTSAYGLQTTLIYPNADNIYNLGESDKRYKDAYATTFHGNLVGNASTATSASKATTATQATKLQTACTINGTAFNGTANITTANWGTARNITITDGTNTSAAVIVNGSANVALKLPATIKASLVGNATSATTATQATKATNDSTGANIATSLANKQNNLGFTPIQQGGGIGQTGNKIYIGWTGSHQLKCTVDKTDLGAFMFEGRAQVGTTITAYWGSSSNTGNNYTKTSTVPTTVSCTSPTFTPVVGQIYSGSQLYSTAMSNAAVGETGNHRPDYAVLYSNLALSGAFNSSYKYLCTTAVGVNAKATVTVNGNFHTSSSGPWMEITGYSGLTKTVQGGKSTFLRVQ